MPSVMREKICPLERLAPQADAWRAQGKSVALCHGCFDLVHPGHLRYLEFARQQADVLVVSLTGDDAIEKADGTRPYIPQELRAENLAAIQLVDAVVIVDGDTGLPVIERLRPDVYIKGREYEDSDHPGFRAERERVETHGGRVIFSSGEVVFSSTRLIDDQRPAMAASGYGEADLITASCRRWGIDRVSLGQIIRQRFNDLRVAVVGDMVCDRYAFCDRGLATDEAPILSVRTSDEQTYLGGAAVIAAHVRSLGAACTLLTSSADDHDAHAMTDKLQSLGVEVDTRTTRRLTPTKLRYIVDNQKVFRVEKGGDEPLDSAAQASLIKAATERANDLDVVIFADFGFGVISPTLLHDLMPGLRKHVHTITGDVSGIRRGLLAMRGFDLVTPNEREARGAVGDFESSLPTLAGTMMRTGELANLIVTLGRKGSLLFRPREEKREAWYTNRLRCDYLPTLAPGPAVDPLGAGDALLAVASLALGCGESLAVAGYLGSVAAGVAVSRMGNEPVRPLELLRFLDHRPELQADDDPPIRLPHAI
ncbi:PfkB family carbohydrate kinase [Mucisphaera calidilacus]|uniref:PfkB family carbohydrate kinase n=1 Tax=Mucisphaera calidilacus TaxID=2527982 RepID=UPI001F27B7BD|nr:PfkB family carbohydrate kinase [Mucisphaera calidilacus]